MSNAHRQPNHELYSEAELHHFVLQKIAHDLASFYELAPEPSPQLQALLSKLRERQKGE